MENAILNSSKDIFLVEFKGNHEHFIFDNNPEVLGNLIQQKNRYGIEKICRYNQSKAKFEKLTAKAVKTLYGWDTHSILQLEKVGFIK